MLKAFTAVANSIRTAVGGILQIVGPSAGSTRTMTTPDADFTAARTDAAQTFAGRQTFGSTISVGNATPSTSGAGITFPATQSASSDANTLDDYEEGTWTPTAVNVTGVTSTSGSYTKIGRVVCVQGRLSTSTSISCTAGSGYLSGLPFTVATVGSTGGIHTASSATATGQIAASGGSGNIYLPTLTAVSSQDFSVTYFV